MVEGVIRLDARERERGRERKREREREEGGRENEADNARLRGSHG